MGKRAGQAESNVNYWGVNIVSSIEALLPIPRKAVYEHPMNAAAKETGPGTSDPFIYNPFTQKRNEKVGGAHFLSSKGTHTRTASRYLCSNKSYWLEMKYVSSRSS